jgi:hypothetical protein
VAANFSHFNYPNKILKPSVIDPMIRETKPTFFAIAGAATFLILFYQEIPGLNYLLFSIGITVFQVLVKPQAFKQKPVIFVSVALGLASGSVAWQASPLGAILTWVFLLLQAAFLLNPGLSTLHIGLKQALLNLLSSIQGLFKLNLGLKSGMFSYLKNGVLFILPILLILIFWFLYYPSNPYLIEINEKLIALRLLIFGKLFEFISLDACMFFGWGLILCLSMFHLFQQKAGNPFSWTLSRADLKKKHSFYFLDLSGLLGSTLANEKVTGLFLMGSLNVILGVVNLTDITWIWFGFQVPDPFSLKEFVHEGTWKLLLSIILSLVIILYYFRGSQNFYLKSLWLKRLALIWIVQNGILLISLLLRDIHYISFHGMAWNRMNLLVFITLTASGLIGMFLKIKDRKNLAFLFQQNGIVASIVLIIYSWLPIDTLMIRYNLNHRNSGEVDVYFYFGAGANALPLIQAGQEKIRLQIEAHQRNKVKWIRYENMDQFKESYQYFLKEFIRDYSQLSLLSSNYRHEQTWQSFK